MCNNFDEILTRKEFFLEPILYSFLSEMPFKKKKLRQKNIQKNLKFKHVPMGDIGI